MTEPYYTRDELRPINCDDNEKPMTWEEFNEEFNKLYAEYKTNQRNDAGSPNGY